MCYAEVNYSVRMRGVRWGSHPKGNRIRLADAGWKEPIKWDKAAEKAGERHRVFCASLADVFEDWRGPILNHKHERVAVGPRGEYVAHDTEKGIYQRWLTMDDCRKDLFDLIDKTPNLDWLLLTKRPENIRKMWPTDSVDMSGRHRKNVWLGTSVSDQKTADKYIPELVKCHDLAPILFLSAEPLLGPIDLFKIDTGMTWSGKQETSKMDCLRGFTSSRREKFVLNGIVEENGITPFVDTEIEGRISWVIPGGESGPRARTCDVNWIRSIIRQCKETGTSCFVKQLGSAEKMPRSSVIKRAAIWKNGQGD